MMQQYPDVFEACRRNDKDMLETLYQSDTALIAARDQRGFTPLILAAYNDAPEAAAFLLQHGAPTDDQDNAGNTALMGVCFRGYAVIAAMLMDAGAEVNQRNFSGATALTFAATFGQLDIAKLLLEHGADTELCDSNGKSPLDHAMIQENHPMVNLIRQYRKDQG